MIAMVGHMHPVEFYPGPMASTLTVKEQVLAAEDNACHQKIQRSSNMQKIVPIGSTTTASQSTCPSDNFRASLQKL
jgi:hypothetical protein